MSLAIQQVGLRVVVLVEQGLPLANHAVHGVVEDCDLYRSVVQECSRQLFGRHLEGAVAINQPHRLLAFKFTGGTHGCADGCRQAVAHRAQATGGNPGVLVLEVNELRSPHLVLAHAGHPDGGEVGQLGELLDDPLRGQRAVGRLVPRHRVFLAPAINCLPPGSQVWLALNGLRALDFRNQIVQHGGHIAHNRHVGLTILADFRRIDIDVDYAGGGGESIQLAGHAIIETGANSHEQIGALHRTGGGDGAMHAQHAEVLRVGVRDDAARGQGGDHGGAGQIGQSLDLSAGVGTGRAAAHVQHRAVGLGEQLGGIG